MDQCKKNINKAKPATSNAASNAPSNAPSNTAQSEPQPKRGRIHGNLKLNDYIPPPMRPQSKGNKRTEASSAAEPTSQPPECILKRPANLARGQVVGVSPRPLKGYAQRKREYEAARLRIFGEARNPADYEFELERVRVYFDRLRINEIRRYIGNYKAANDAETSCSSKKHELPKQNKNTLNNNNPQSIDSSQ